MIIAFIYQVSSSFQLEYLTIKDFYDNSLFGDKLYRLLIMQGITWVLLIPLNLQKNMSRMRFTTILGITCLLIITIVIIIQLPSYITYYHDNNIPYNPNWYNLNKAISKSKLDVFSAFATIIFSYNCHYGVFAVDNMLKKNNKERMRKVIKRSVLLDGSFYLVVGVVGYLTQPDNVENLVIDRMKIGETDYLITVCRLLTAIMLICKLPVSFNSLRNSLLNLIFNDNEVNIKRNLLITIPLSILTSVCGALYTDIDNIISFLGGFGSTSIAYLLPLFVYIRRNKLGMKHYKNICSVIFFGILIGIGYFSAGMSLYKIVR